MGRIQGSPQGHERGVVVGALAKVFKGDLVADLSAVTGPHEEVMDRKGDLVIGEQQEPQDEGRLCGVEHALQVFVAGDLVIVGHVSEVENHGVTSALLDGGAARLRLPWAMTRSTLARYSAALAA